mmetsp:Transcript_14687/g.21933  ORF Transcript_14687/g.21933 Transcript_14687/m.21933 type:complete len:93 (+) Transcript_14687:1427-1705(+)
MVTVTVMADSQNNNPPASSKYHFISISISHLIRNSLHFTGNQWNTINTYLRGVVLLCYCDVVLSPFFPRMNEYEYEYGCDRTNSLRRPPPAE